MGQEWLKERGKTKFIRTTAGKIVFYTSAFIILFLIYVHLFKGIDLISFNPIYLLLKYFLEFLLLISNIIDNPLDLVLAGILIWGIVWLLKRVYAILYGYI